MLCYKKQQVCLEKKKYHGIGKKAEVIWNFIGTPLLFFRKYKHEYRPREKKVTNTALCSATEEGDFTIFLSVCCR